MWRAAFGKPLANQRKMEEPSSSRIAVSRMLAELWRELPGTLQMEVYGSGFRV